MVQIKHRIGIKAPVQKVYQALATVSGIAGWWTSDTSGISGIGETIIVRFHHLEGKEIGSMNMQVKALELNQKVHWKFTDGPAEWIDTDVLFDLQQQDDYTIVLFSHEHWREEVEFKSHCSMKWAVFLLSLKRLVETGIGQPSPNDVKIDNWN